MKEIKDLSTYKVQSGEVLLQGVNESSNLGATAQLRELFAHLTENTRVCVFTLHGIIEKTASITDQHLTWLFKIQGKMDADLPEKKQIGKYDKSVHKWTTWTKEVESMFDTMDAKFKETYPKPTTERNQLLVLGTIIEANEGLKVRGVNRFDSNLQLPLNKAMFADVDGVLTPKFEIGQSFEVLVKGKETKYLQINPSPVVVGKLAEVEQ